MDITDVLENIESHIRSAALRLLTDGSRIDGIIFYSPRDLRECVSYHSPEACRRALGFSSASSGNKDWCRHLC
jgi:hypothetical protein